MKKFLTAVLTVCLVFALCVSSFAAFDVSTVVDQVKGYITEMGSAPSADVINVTAKKIVSAIDEAGANSKAEVIDAADKLYNDGVIDKAVYDEIVKVANDTEFTTGAIDNVSDAINQIKNILTDSSKSTEEKVSAISAILGSGSFNTEQVQTILDTLHTSGILSDDMYNKISDALNSSELPSIGGSTGTTGGVSDFINGILSQLGIGGGSSGDDSTTTGGSSSNNSKFEGANAKTGDYAVVSVAGVALVAGIALVLTKKKK